MSGEGHLLSRSAWPAVPRPTTAVVVPLGSTEQHGHHLPFDTDTRVAAALAGRLTDRRPGFVLAPALGYGASGEHQDFPGTLSIGTAVLTVLLIEFGRSASCWAERLLLVNGHGGNLAALAAAVATLGHEGHDVAYWSAGVPGGDAHAGRVETSLLLAICPEVVRQEDAVAGPTAALAELMPAMRAGGVSAVSPTGVLGDPAGAGAEEGRALLADLSGHLDRAVDGWLRTGRGGRLG